MKHTMIPLLMTMSLLASGNVMAQKDTTKDEAKPAQQIAEKVKQMILPRIHLSNTSLEEVIDFLRLRSREVDPGKSGINFILHIKAKDKKVIKNLKVENISMSTVIQAITQKTGTKAVVTDYAVIITDQEVNLIDAYGHKHGMDDPFGDAGGDSVKELKPEAARLRQTVIPLISFSNTTLEESLDFLRLRTRELSTDKKEVNFLVVRNKNKDARINLQLRDVPLFDVMSYIAFLTNSQLKFTEDAVIITDHQVNLTDPYRYEYKDGGDAFDGDPFGGDPFGGDPFGGDAVKVLKPGVARLQRVIVPSVDFDNVSLEECLDFLRLRARELLTDKKGINFIVGKENAIPNHFSLKLRNVSLFNILRYVSLLTDSELKFTEDAVFINPRKRPSELGWLTKIVIPRVSFSNVSPEDALVFIHDAIQAQDPDNKAKIVLGGQISEDIKVNMKLRNVPVLVVLEYLARACNASLSISREEGVRILSLNRKGADSVKADDPFAGKPAQPDNPKKPKNPFLRDGGKKDKE